MKRIVISVLLTCLPLATALSQDKSYNIVPPAPNVASLGQYGDWPVSNYTGVPEINLPIYTIKIKDFEFPISMNYHSSGIKVSQQASEIGLGWTLQAYGVINQNVVGWDDFDTWGYMNLRQPDPGPSGLDDSNNYLQPNFYLHGAPSPPTCGSTQDFNSIVLYLIDNDDVCLPICNGIPSYMSFDCQLELLTIGMADDYFSNPKSDMSPDLFYFTTGNNSGKFVWDKKNEKFETIDRSNTVINFLGKDSGFVILEPDGSKYYFQDIELHESASATLLAGQGDGSTSIGSDFRSFFLSKIETKDGYEIEFLYEKGESICQLINLSEIYRADLDNLGQNTEYTAGLIQTLHQGSYEPLRLTQIKFPYGTIDFNWGSRLDIRGDKRIESIEVKNELDDIIKTVTFHNDSYFNGHVSHSYINQSIAQTTNSCDGSPYTENELFKRLKLERVVFSDIGEYQFEYNESVSLPSKLSYAQDYWGYYNGNDLADSFIPDPFSHYEDPEKLIDDPFFKSQDRRPNENGQACNLEKIIYPTGGYTSFEFEHNTFSNWALPSEVNTINELEAVELIYSNSGNNTLNNVSEFTIEKEQDVFIKVHFPADYEDNPNISTQNMKFFITKKTDGGIVFEEKFADAGGSNGFSCEAPFREYLIHLFEGDYRMEIQKDAAAVLCIENDVNSLSGKLLYSKSTENQFSFGAGFRLKKMIKSDSESEITNTYKYHYDLNIDNKSVDKSYGRAMNIPTFYRKYVYFGNFSVNTYNASRVLDISSQPIAGYSTSARGSFIGYDQVEVQQTDEYGNSIGKTIYEYLNTDDLTQIYNLGQGVSYLENGNIKKISYIKE
ncbi:MAG: hypothetical protein AAF901_09625, partial [Bacteroidota bacterium]